jgi:hypothetical protein
MPFIDLHAHFAMHHEIPDDPGQKILFDSLNATINYEDLQPRVSLKRWFDDNSDNAVTGFGSVLYDPQDDFFVDDRTLHGPRRFSTSLINSAALSRRLRTTNESRLPETRMT